MVLSDWEIVLLIAKGDIVITPLIDVESQIGASSVDLRLGTEFRVIRRLLRSHFDLNVRKDKVREEVREYTEVVHLRVDSPFILHPGEFALATTLEYLRIPEYLAAHRGSEHLGPRWTSNSLDGRICRSGISRHFDI